MQTRARVIFHFFVIFIFFGLIASCSSSDDADPVSPPAVQPEDDQVEISLITGWWQGTPEEGQAADIPANVSAIRLTIDTADSTIYRQTTLADGDLRGEFSVLVATGQRARFQMEATNQSDEFLYRGVFYRLVPAQDDSLFLTRAPVTDETAPTMASSLTVIPRSGEDLELTWEMATTGRGPNYEASYLIWVTPSGELAGNLPTMTTATEETSLLLSHLQPKRPTPTLVSMWMCPPGRIVLTTATGTTRLRPSPIP